MSVETESPNGYDFFVSWAHKTMAGYATDLADEFRARGYTSFFSAWCMDPATQGEDAKHELQSALGSCNGMVVIIDTAATRSDWMRWEIAEFLRVTDKSQRLFVIYFDGVGAPDHSGDAERDQRLAELSKMFGAYQRDVTSALLEELRREPRAELLRESGNPVEGGLTLSPSIVRRIIERHGHAPKSGGPVGYDLEREIEHRVGRRRRPSVGCVVAAVVALLCFVAVVVAVLGIGFLVAKWALSGMLT